jgi:hypothetical protein
VCKYKLIRALEGNELPEIGRKIVVRNVWKSGILPEIGLSKNTKALPEGEGL